MSVTINGTTGITAPDYSGPTLGVIDGSDAAAGQVGEVITATVPSGSAGTLTNGIAGNLTAISLTAGDWDVSCYGAFIVATGPATFLEISISTTSVTLGSEDGTGMYPFTVTAGFTAMLPSPVKRLSLTATTTVYAVARAGFSGGSVSIYGGIRARRVR